MEEALGIAIRSCEVLGAPECCEALPTLRTLRSQIERERPFVEAAMAFGAQWILEKEVLDSADMDSMTRFEVAYRALSEKPPEEGGK